MVVGPRNIFLYKTLSGDFFILQQITNIVQCALNDPKLRAGLRKCRMQACLNDLHKFYGCYQIFRNAVEFDILNPL